LYFYLRFQNKLKETCIINDLTIFTLFDTLTILELRKQRLSGGGGVAENRNIGVESDLNPLFGNSDPFI